MVSHIGAADAKKHIVDSGIRKELVGERGDRGEYRFITHDQFPKAHRRNRCGGG